MQYYCHRPYRRLFASTRPLLQSQLTDLHHQSLLREQAQLERYYEIHCGSRASQYESQILEKQRQIADLLQTRKTVNRDRLLNWKMESELQYQQMLREMELNSYLNTSRQNRISMEVRKNELASFKHFNSQDMSYEGQQTRQKQKLMRQYDMHSRRRAMSVSLTNDNHHSGKENKKNSSKVKDQPKGTTNKAVDKSTISGSSQMKNIPFSYKPKYKRISNERTSAISPQRLNHPSYQVLKHSRKNKSAFPANDAKTNPSERISQRLRLSKTIYKDSELRNLKHESVHLFSTFQNESRLRKQLKNRINNTPAVIEKYSIVVK